MTTHADAARQYGAAERESCRGGDPLPFLDRARRLDPAFVVAAVDHAVLAGNPLPDVGQPATRWERHHVDIMRAIHAGQLSRAAGLLHEHLIEEGCDPIARLALAMRGRTLHP